MFRFGVVLMALVLGSLPVAAQETPAPAPEPRGYVDLDRDGANDRFRDANGDGVDDVTGSAYAHNFRYVDADQDGVNDLFVDQDGDGVNDLDGRFTDEDGDGICDNVIDYDGDKVNDITGLRYGRRSLKGFRYGRVDEATGAVHQPYVDEDGDGMDDQGERGRASRGGLGGAGVDRFVDEDGDGICDGRTVKGRTNRLPMPGKGAGMRDRNRERGSGRQGEQEKQDDKSKGGKP